MQRKGEKICAEKLFPRKRENIYEVLWKSNFLLKRHTESKIFIKLEFFGDFLKPYARER